MILREICTLVSIGLLAGCAAPKQEYWNRPDTRLQQTAADLSECRMRVVQGQQQVYTARELESPCMVSKGYALSDHPPPN